MHVRGRTVLFVPGLWSEIIPISFSSGAWRDGEHRYLAAVIVNTPE